MKISHNWLKQYVEHDLSPQQLAERLTMAGLEVDDVEEIGAPLSGVVVGRVARVRPHPNADRLVLCDVDLGEGDRGEGDRGEFVQIACGAPNVAEGQRVPVATVGTTLLLPSKDNPNERQPVTIEKAELRGASSRGMICAEDELGLSDDHSGIMILEDDAEVGEPFEQYLRRRGLEPHDAVLNIDLTPNRPDAASHLGVARDVAALTNAVLLRPDVELPEAGGAAAEQVSIDLQDPSGCPRYAALLVRGVEVGESPAWLKKRLAAIGLRPRNNVVDVTNFVLHECGQPLHAFDLEKIAGPKIVVRCAAGGESFTTLDGQERALPAGTLLICDAERPVALAGLMGGANSEVSAATTDVLIESAYFDPSTIRRAAKTLGLSTDASYRFERGVDRAGQVWAAARAARLIAELGGGAVVPGLAEAHPKPPQPREVPLRPGRANRLLGTDIATEDMTDLLEALGFVVEQRIPLEEMAEQALEGKGWDLDASEAALQCTVPPFRPDVTREVDLIEEVARLYGYDHIPAPQRMAVPATAPREAPATALRRRARSLLAGLGLREIYTNSLLPTARAERFHAPAQSAPAGAGERHAGDGGIVTTLKPQSEAMAALRPSLLPGLLGVMRYNRNRGQRALRFFEFGRVFRRTERAGTIIPGYAEHESLLLAVSGPAAEAGWATEARTADVFDLKGLAEALLRTLRVPGAVMTPADKSTGSDAPLLTQGLRIASGETPLGTLGRVAAPVAADFDLDEAPVFVAELDWSTLATLAAPHLRRTYAPVSTFPTAERDLAVLVDKSAPAAALLATICSAGGPLLQAAEVFDLYEGEGVEAGQKSLAFTLRFAANRTLRDEEVDAAVSAVVDALHAEHGAVLRQ